MASKLLDQYGRPVEDALLREEIASAQIAGLRTVWQDPVATTLMPSTLAALLHDAELGEATAYLTLAEEMEEREPHYSSVMRVRKLAVSSLPVAIESPSDDPEDVKITDEVRELFARPSAGELISDLLDAIGKGYSVCEIMWERSLSRWEPREYIWRDPRFFRFDRVEGRELRMLTLNAPPAAADDLHAMLDPASVPLAPYKFVVHRPRMKSGLQIRGGLARLAAASYLCKSFTLRDWMAFAEVYGMPLRIGKYGPQATDKDIRTLINAVANLGTDAAAVIPQSMTLELVAAASSAGGEALFEKLATWLDHQTSKAVLGQTMTSDSGHSSGLAQAKVHDEVRNDIRADDAVKLATTLDRDLIRAYVDLNHGPRKRYPSASFSIEEPEDLVSLAKALPPFLDRGLKVEASAIRDKFKLAEPAPDAELLTAASSPAPAPAGNRLALHRSGPAADQLDEMEDEALDGWQKLADPVLEPVKALVQRARSMKELKAGLAQLAGQLDTSALADQLARYMFEAHMLGDATDQD